MKILVFDNYDSFTYNLVHLVEKITGTPVEVHRNDQISLDEVEQFDRIILSPGPGIPEDEIPVVLASFGQGSNAIKSAEQGAGLGLPIAKSLVDLHGGTFTLKSKLRVGTEVIIALPPERVMAALAPLAEPSPALQPKAPTNPVEDRNSRRNAPLADRHA